jgi:hypothetical protein
MNAIHTRNRATLAAALLVTLLAGCATAEPPSDDISTPTPTESSLFGFDGNPCDAYQQEPFELEKTSTEYTAEDANGDQYESSLEIAGAVTVTEVFASCPDESFTPQSRLVSIDVGIHTPGEDAMQRTATLTIDEKSYDAVSAEINKEDGRESTMALGYRTLVFELPPDVSGEATLTVTLDGRHPNGNPPPGWEAPVYTVAIPFDLAAAGGTDTTTAPEPEEPSDY